MPEFDVERVKSKLRDAPWGPMRNNEWTSTNTIHEKIKADLSYLGVTEGFIPLPEFYADSSDSNGHKIDMGWFSRETYDPIVAIEVDGGVSQHSIDKLNRMPSGVDRVIVSKSPNKTYIKRNIEDLPADFIHIDAQVWKSD